MNQAQFIRRVHDLRGQGKSIRAVATELGVHRNRVHRALTRIPADKSTEGLARGIFVGRETEMTGLATALDEAASGKGRLVMVTGEPGIGKTRTTLEFALRAEARDTRVIKGRCFEERGPPPYWPWVQAIRAYVREYDAETLRSAMGPGAADIAELVPEIAEALPDLQPPPALEPEQARFRLFDSITAFLKKASERQTVVLVLDNLHWADRSSLLLLEFLAHELSDARILLIGTYRDVELSRQHPLSQTLGELTKLPSFQRLPLSGLTQEETGQIIEVVSGASPPPELVRVVHAQTEGNPLFVTEIARVLEREGALSLGREHHAWEVTVPVGVREAISRHFNHLSETCTQALTTASVVGREFDFRLLETLHDDLSEEELLNTIDEALGARVIEEVDGGEERYQFTHSLVQQALNEELSVSRRVRLHGRIGEALEELYGDEVETHATELAYHFGEAASVLGPEKLVSYSLLAGERALAAFAYEEALDYFERVLAVKEGQKTDGETAGLLFGLGRAQAATLHNEEARVCLSRAFDYYADVRGVASAVAVAEFPLLPVPGITNFVELIARALALVPADSHDAGRLLPRYGLALGLEMRDYEGAQEAFRKALVIAQRDGDLVLEMRTLAADAELDWRNLHWRQNVEKGLRVIELARSIDDPRAEVNARFYVALSMFNMGALDAMWTHGEAMLALAERLRDRYWLALTLWINGTAWRYRGDWQTARDFFERGLAIGPSEPRLLCSLGVVEYQAGNFSQGEAYMDRLVEVMRLTPPGPVNEYG